MNFPYLREALLSLFQKPSTYPQARPAAPQYRGRPVYHPDRCINCGLCMRVCSPGAITRQVEVDEDKRQHITFTMDLSSCTFCAMCADFCSKNAITFTDDYHMVGTEPSDFLVTGSFIKEPPAPRPAASPKPPQAPIKDAEQ